MLTKQAAICFLEDILDCQGVRVSVILEHAGKLCCNSHSNIAYNIPPTDEHYEAVDEISINESSKLKNIFAYLHRLQKFQAQIDSLDCVVL
jgi:hypothetical protein